MTIKTEMLRCFCAIARTGNLSDAAARMGRSPSALSMTLKQLEAHLGQRLFETERKNRLTPLGARVFELAQQQLYQFDETIDAIETAARAPGGLIRVVSVPSVAALVFPAALEEMQSRHPDLMLDLRDTDTRQVIDQLVQGRADIGIASASFALNGVQAVPLFDDGFGVVCSPGHPLAQQEAPPTIAQVVAAGYVHNPLCDQISTQAFRLAVQGAPVTIHNTLSLIAMLRRGRHVTVLPQAVTRLVPGEVLFRPIQGIEDRRQVVLYLRESSPHRELVEEFRDIITARRSHMIGNASAVP